MKTELTEGQVQEICRKLVRREVIECASTLVWELTQGDFRSDRVLDEYPELWQGPVSIGEYTCPDCGHYWEDEPEYVAEVVCPECETGLDIDTDFEATEYREVFEHWIVSSYLAEKLQDQGETIVRDFFGFTIWCRTTTGQAILLDSVIVDIAHKIGLFSGVRARNWLEKR